MGVCTIYCVLFFPGEIDLRVNDDNTRTIGVQCNMQNHVVASLSDFMLFQNVTDIKENAQMAYLKFIQYTQRFIRKFPDFSVEVSNISYTNTNKSNTSATEQQNVNYYPGIEYMISDDDELPQVTYHAGVSVDARIQHEIGVAGPSGFQKKRKSNGDTTTCQPFVNNVE